MSWSQGHDLLVSQRVVSGAEVAVRVDMREGR